MLSFIDSAFVANLGGFTKLLQFIELHKARVAGHFSWDC